MTTCSTACRSEEQLIGLALQQKGLNEISIFGDDDSLLLARYRIDLRIGGSIATGQISGMQGIVTVIV